MKKGLTAVAAGVVAVAAVALPLVLVHRVEVAERGNLQFDTSQLATSGNATCNALPGWYRRLAPGDRRTEGVILDYLVAQEESPAGTAARNPFVESYRAAEFDDFAKWLAANEPPAWPEWMPSPSDAVPNLFEVRRLNKLILAAAMARAAANDTAGAERMLEASWRLNEKMRTNPILIVQLVSESMFHEQLAALRKVDVDGPKWAPRLRETDYVSSIGMSCDAWASRLDRLVRDNVFASAQELRGERTMYAALHMSPPLRPQWLQMLRTPIRWFDLPYALAGNHAVVEALATVPRSEHIDRDLDRAFARGASEWGYIPDPDVPGASRNQAFRRAVRVEAERELTEKVLLARDVRRGTGRWPDGLDPSSKLANAQWVYETTPSGATIRLSRTIEWGLTGTNVPLRCDLR